MNSKISGEECQWRPRHVKTWVKSQMKLEPRSTWSTLKTWVKSSPMSWCMTKLSKLKSQANLGEVGQSCQCTALLLSFILSEVSTLWWRLYPYPSLLECIHHHACTMKIYYFTLQVPWRWTSTPSMTTKMWMHTLCMPWSSHINCAPEWTVLCWVREGFF